MMGILTAFISKDSMYMLWVRGSLWDKSRGHKEIVVEDGKEAWSFAQCEHKSLVVVMIGSRREESRSLEERCRQLKY
jgi:hypothetical protein